MLISEVVILKVASVCIFSLSLSLTLSLSLSLSLTHSFRSDCLAFFTKLADVTGVAVQDQQLFFKDHQLENDDRQDLPRTTVSRVTTGI